MTETRKSHLYPTADQDKGHHGGRHGAARAKRRAGVLAAAATVYRGEFERDFGPDLDEPLDVTESGHEF
jgi:hypothetical protein